MIGQRSHNPPRQVFHLQRRSSVFMGDCLADQVLQLPRVALLGQEAQRFHDARPETQDP